MKRSNTSALRALYHAIEGLMTCGFKLCALIILLTITTAHGNLAMGGDKIAPSSSSTKDRWLMVPPLDKTDGSGACLLNVQPNEMVQRCLLAPARHVLASLSMSSDFYEIQPCLANYVFAAKYLDRTRVGKVGVGAKYFYWFGGKPDSAELESISFQKISEFQPIRSGDSQSVKLLATALGYETLISFGVAIDVVGSSFAWSAEDVKVLLTVRIWSKEPGTEDFRTILEETIHPQAYEVQSLSPPGKERHLDTAELCEKRT